MDVQVDGVMCPLSNVIFISVVGGDQGKKEGPEG